MVVRSVAAAMPVIAVAMTCFLVFMRFPSSDMWCTCTQGWPDPGSSARNFEYGRKAQFRHVQGR
jgi:hypothetical protein